MLSVWVCRKQRWHFLHVVITYCKFHGTTSIQFLIILFSNKVPVHLHNPVTPFQPDFRGRASVGNVKNLCNNGILFSFYFYLVGSELESVAVIRIGMLRVVVTLTRLSMVENLSSSDLSEAKKVKGA